MNNPAAATNDAQIRAIMDDWVEAVRARDLDKLTADYAPEVLVCDLTAPLHKIGVESYRQHCAGWFGSWQGPIGCERRDLQISAGEDVAFACCLTHNSGTLGDGTKVDFWVRVTLGFRKMAGAWKVVHEHVSLPFDMQTMQACLHLQP